MRLGNRDISTGDLLPADRFPVFLNVFKTLVWLWVFSAVVAMKPSAAEGSPQKTVRKETPKNKPTPKTDSTRKISNSPAHNALFRQEPAPVDPLEKREHVVQQTKLGDTLPELLSRFRLPQTEKQLWTRSVRRSFGAQALPPGKEIHFYFLSRLYAVGARGRQANLKRWKLTIMMSRPSPGKRASKESSSRSVKSLMTSS